MGSWTALYEHRKAKEPERENVISSLQNFALNASGNFVHSEKFVAIVGIDNLVVVETEDALLITTRENAQDVGKIVAFLDREEAHEAGLARPAIVRQSLMATPIKFGTDGWRGIIADDYTFENVRRVGNAIAHYVHEKEDATKGLVVGYDTRFGSRAFAEAISEVLAAAGIVVHLSDDYTPTPALSYAVVNLASWRAA